MERTQELKIILNELIKEVNHESGRHHMTGSLDSIKKCSNILIEKCRQIEEYMVELNSEISK